MTNIHPTACVEPKAQLGHGVEIGPHCYIGPDAVIGDHCRVHHNVTVVGRTTLGQGNELFPGVVLGTPPQDLKYRGELTSLIIGNDNVFREHVTAHPGTAIAGGETRIGNHNRFMVGAHLAHDVTVGSGCILANSVQIAGHVHLEDCVTMGGMVGVHHFCTVGRLSYTAGLTRVTVDIPPFMIFGGDPGHVRGVNATGMERWGFDEESVQYMRHAYKELFSRRAVSVGDSLAEKLDRIENGQAIDTNVKMLIDFVRRSLVNGVYGRYRESQRSDSDEDRSTFYESVREEAIEP